MDKKAQQTILIVEDDPITQGVIKMNLVDEGYNVLTAEDGLDGVRLAKKAKPGIILMDMRLPSINGWEATRRLKAQRETSQIPVIALTAQSTSADLRRCFEAGCDAFMTKPVQFAQLYTKIEMLLRQSASIIDS